MALHGVKLAFWFSLRAFLDSSVLLTAVLGEVFVTTLNRDVF